MCQYNLKGLQIYQSFNFVMVYPGQDCRAFKLHCMSLMLKRIDYIRMLMASRYLALRLQNQTYSMDSIYNGSGSWVV